MLFLITGDFMVIPLLFFLLSFLSFLHLTALAFMILWHTLCTHIYFIPSPPLPRLFIPYPFLKNFFLVRVLSGWKDPPAVIDDFAITGSA